MLVCKITRAAICWINSVGHRTPASIINMAASYSSVVPRSLAACWLKTWCDAPLCDPAHLNKACMNLYIIGMNLKTAGLRPLSEAKTASGTPTHGVNMETGALACLAVVLTSYPDAHRLESHWDYGKSFCPWPPSFIKPRFRFFHFFSLP